MQGLYQGEITGVDGSDVVERLAEHFGATPAAERFARELIGGVSDRRDEIDRILTGALEHWSLDRLSGVERCILRVAICEMIYLGTPHGIAIDEAIEITRRFGGEGSEGFVNGVLDHVARHAAPRVVG